jgi:hypothetical protein
VIAVPAWLFRDDRDPILQEGIFVNLRFIDWIWHVRGRLPLAPGQGGEQAFERLIPLFGQAGTCHERTGDRLTFRKKDQAAQDRMSIFDGGTLHIEKDASGLALHYHLVSRALLLCCLAPLLFLAFAQLTVALARFDKPPVETGAAPAEKARKQAALPPQNAIDKALGSPAPEKPKKDDDGKGAAKKKHSPVSAYVFACIFAVLYISGRILESVMVRALFRKALQSETELSVGMSGTHDKFAVEC